MWSSKFHQIRNLRDTFKRFRYTKKNNEQSHHEASGSAAPQRNVIKAPLPFGKNIPKSTCSGDNNGVSLDVDMGGVLTKVNVPVSILELAKIKPQRVQIRKIFNLDKEPEDPLVIVQKMYYDRKNGGYAPFLLSLVINDLMLHNCMLDSRASSNVTPLRVMNQLELQITRPYRNVWL